MRKGLVLVATLLVFALAVLPAHAAVQYLNIGTGGVTGLYYPTGGNLAKMLNKKRAEYNLRATVESTAGSVYNINALMKGDLDFGIVQSDRQYQALKGLKEWKGEPQGNLRAVFSIYSEAVTLLAGADTGIETVEQLKGKVVYIGAPGSGQRTNALDLLKVSGIDAEADLTAKGEGIMAAEMAGMLQTGQLDATFYTVGHPNDAVEEAFAGLRKVRFIPVDPVTISMLVADHGYYAPAYIPVADYPAADNNTRTGEEDEEAVEPVPTFGVKATLCTRADVADEVVYALVKEVFDNLEEFKKMNAAYKGLTRESMLEGLTAPLHPGAEKYFKEAGLLE